MYAIPDRCLLLKIVRNNDTLSSRVFRSLAVNDVEALHLVRQCCCLESIFDSNITTKVLCSPDKVSFTQILRHRLCTSFYQTLQPIPLNALSRVYL